MLTAVVISIYENILFRNGLKSSSAVTPLRNKHNSTDDHTSRDIVKPKIPLRRRKSPITKVQQPAHKPLTSDLPGSFVCLTKIKKDLENTRKRINLENNTTESIEDNKKIGKFFFL